MMTRPRLPAIVAAVGALMPAMALAQEAVAPAAPPVAAKSSLSLWDMLIAGGPPIIPIAICSFVLLLVVFERTIALRRSRVVPKLFVERFLLQISEGAVDRHGALEMCDDDSSLAAGVFASALRKWGKSAVEVEQAVLDEGERAANSMRRFLRVINGVSTVCPLFGLLGTVWGMIDSFNEIAGSSAMGRPELLAGGIGTALVSTAAGLCVAIPALILYLYFVGRVDALVMELDRYGQDLVNLISAEAQEDRRNRPPRTTKVKKAA